MTSRSRDDHTGPRGPRNHRGMNLVDVGLSPVRRLMGRAPSHTCFVCHERILPSEERLRLRGETVVHRRCATYRTRTRRPPGSRLGFPG
jgi:hypothetical protein